MILLKFQLQQLAAISLYFPYNQGGYDSQTRFFTGVQNDKKVRESETILVCNESKHFYFGSMILKAGGGASLIGSSSVGAGLRNGL